MSNSLDSDQARCFVGLIGVQTVCKGYQQTPKVTTSGKRVNMPGSEDKIYRHELCLIFLTFPRKYSLKFL